MNSESTYLASDIIAEPLLLAHIVPRARLAVIGNPVAHSLSPVFQNAALRACDIDASYIRIEAREENFFPLLHTLVELDFIGVNVTVPFKHLALAATPLLDASARQARGANTLLFSAGEMRAYSTDGIGLSRAIEEAWGHPLRDYTPAILGAGGGAGQAAVGQCIAEGCREVFVLNRTREKLQVFEKSDRIKIADFSDLSHADLIINATSLGLKSGDSAPLDTAHIRPGVKIFDMVYAKHPSALSQAALQAKAEYATGLAMLLHQGAAAFSIWFPQCTLPMAEMRAALKNTA